MITWCIDELQYKAKKFRETGLIATYDGDVAKSDTIIPLCLRNAFKVAAAPLENIRAEDRDWHLGSGDIVQDLVDPSLFPVVYGRTRILRDSVVGLDDCVKRCGDGVTLRVPPVEANCYGYSRKYQWLPCDVAFQADRVRYVFHFVSYRTKKIQTLSTE
jgi:Protein of unknown function (DUF4246)